MVEGGRTGDGFLTSVCSSSERLLHEKKGFFHKMTQAVPLSRLWVCTVPLGQCPARGLCTRSPGIFSPPSCPDETSGAAEVFTHGDEDGRACWRRTAVGATLLRSAAVLSSSAGGGRESLWATEVSFNPLLGSFGCMEVIR